MIKRNIGSIFLIFACIINISTVDFSNLTAPKSFWMLLLFSLLLILSVVFIFVKEYGYRKKINSDKVDDL